MKRTCRKMSEEQKQQISKTMLEKKIVRSDETKRKISEANRGKKISQEHKNKLSEGLRKYWENLPLVNLPDTSIPNTEEQK